MEGAPKSCTDAEFSRYLSKNYVQSWNSTRYDLNASEFISLPLNISHMPSGLFCNLPADSHSVVTYIVE